MSCHHTTLQPHARLLWRHIVLIFLCAVPAAQARTEVGNPLSTVLEPAYNAATTYAKLSHQFPDIRIASDVVPPTVRAITSIPYVAYAGRALHLDLYLPRDQPTPSPSIVLVHGGGWRAGERSNLAPLAIRMAERGYAAAVISYRLSGEAPYPAAIHDVNAALRWVRSNAKRYQLDPHHIAVAGGSAGGQIASLVGVSAGMEKFDPQARTSKVSSAAQAIINIDGLSDFTSPEARFHEDDPNKKVSSAGAWFGGRYAEKPALWHEASPTFYVKNGMPPILFIGSGETRFSVGRSEMIEKMRALQQPFQVFLLPGTPHSFWLFDPWLTPTVDAMTRFLNDVFMVMTKEAPR